MNYEVSTGTYKEDLVDFNVIQYFNKAREQGINIDYDFIDLVIDQVDINVLMTKLKSIVTQCNYVVYTKNLIEFYTKDFFCTCTINYELKNMKVDLIGNIDLIKHYKNKLIAEFKFSDDVIKMSWYYSVNGRTDNADIPVESNNNPVYPCHYPFVKGGLDTFLNNYMNSPQAILLLIGDPGTGKTSFIRHFVSKYKLNSIVTYDEDVMMKDDFYINFLTNIKQNLLIVEDADVLLQRRETTNNKIMSKFLNVSEGLVKGVNKKIIFSTNLANLNNVDEALIREGRCFDIIEFRHLTLNEANEVSHHHGLPPLTSGSDFTLSKVFNRGIVTDRRRKVGF